MKRPHILHITSNYPPTPCGIGDYTQKLASELERNNLKVSVLTRNQGTKSEDRFDVIKPVSGWNLFYTRQLWRAIEELAPDIIHLQYEPMSFRESFSLPLALGVSKIPVVSTVHEVGEKNNLQELRDGFFYDRCKHLIVNDQGCFERLLKFRKSTENRLTKIGVGSGILSFPEWSLEKYEFRRESREPFKLAYFGFFSESKGTEFLLRAVHLLNYQFKEEIRLVMVGAFFPQYNRYHKRLVQLTQELNLEKYVTFTGQLPEKDASQIIANCDLAVLPFSDGASPRRSSLQACLGLKMPVITTKGIYHDEAFVENKTAIFLPHLTSDELVRNILAIIREPVILQNLSCGADVFRENFTWTAIAEKHCAIYRQVLSQAARGL